MMMDYITSRGALQDMFHIARHTTPIVFTFSIVFKGVSGQNALNIWLDPMKISEMWCILVFFSLCFITYYYKAVILGSRIIFQTAQSWKCNSYCVISYVCKYWCQNLAAVFIVFEAKHRLINRWKGIELRFKFVIAQSRQVSRGTVQNVICPLCS